MKSIKKTKTVAQLVQRQRAIATGATREGHPCRGMTFDCGGTTTKLVSTGNCVACMALRNAANRADPVKRAKKRADAKAWNKQHPDWFAADRAKGRVRQRLIKAGFSKAQAFKQTPDLPVEEFVTFYAEARMLTKSTGIRHEVDHRIALKLGGLHHPSNLQVITAAENRAKGTVETALIKQVTAGLLTQAAAIRRLMEYVKQADYPNIHNPKAA